MNESEDRSLPQPAVSDIRGVLGLDTRTDTRKRRRLVLGAVAALVVGVLFVSALQRDEAQVRYTTEPARKGNLTVNVTATGTLQPINQVTIGSELSGTIRTVEVDFNDRVTVGQVLARLDTTRLEAQVLQSKAAVTAAQARVTEAEASEKEAASQLARLERVRQLSGGKVPSAQELTAQQAAVARARAVAASTRAAVSQAQATLDTQQTDLSKAVIHSPISGIVLTRSVEPGQTVAASLQAPVLFTLAEDLTRMELHVSVDEADVGQVREDQDATFTVDTWPDRVFPARVTQVRYGAQTVEGVVTYETVLSVDNSQNLLRPGMTATAEITVRQLNDAVLVPNAALRFTPPQPKEQPTGGLLRALLPTAPFGRRNNQPTRELRQHVWVLRDGTPQQIEIAAGASDGTFTEVTDGSIEPGTELIVDAVEQS